MYLLQNFKLLIPLYYYHNIYYIHTVPTCPSLISPSNGGIICLLGRNRKPDAGESCYFTCDDGYDLDGSANRTCKNDKSWSGIAPTCVKSITFIVRTCQMKFLCDLVA